MADGYIQVAADGSGKKVDNAEITRADGTVVERQRVVQADNDDVGPMVTVGGEAGRGEARAQDRSVRDLLQDIHETLRRIEAVLQEAVCS